MHASMNFKSSSIHQHCEKKMAPAHVKIFVLLMCTAVVNSSLVADTEFGKVSNKRTHEFKSHRMLYTRQCTKQLSTVGGGSRENSQWSDGQELARRAIRCGPRGQLAVQTGAVNEFVVDRFSLICLHNSHNDSVAAG